MTTYYEKNKERLLIKQKQYYLDNKERAKQYYQENKDKLIDYQKNYNKEYNKTPQCKKSHLIHAWKKSGLVSEDYEAVYKRYLDTSVCDVCQYQFDEKNWRCMDHDHETGYFRQILCNRCNIRDNWRHKLLNIKLPNNEIVV